MRRNELLKRLLLLVMMGALVLALVPAALAQEGETPATEEVVAEEEAAEEGGSPLDPLGINTGLLLVQIFNFLILMFIVRAVLWGPAINMLDARSEKIKKGLEDAAAAAKARQNAETEAEKILAAARTERAKLLEEARAQGEELAKSIQAQARTEAEKIRNDATVDAKAARDAELAGLREQVINISTAVAGRVINERLDAAKQRALVDEFFSKVPADARNLSGSVEVVSAMPLTDDEQARVKKELGADNVTFTVDPSILGGIVVRTSERVIDGSVRRNMSELVGRLN